MWVLVSCICELNQIKIKVSLGNRVASFMVVVRNVYDSGEVTIPAHFAKPTAGWIRCCTHLFWFDWTRHEPFMLEEPE